jgi:hypothetical protein
LDHRKRKLLESCLDVNSKKKERHPKNKNEEVTVSDEL